MLKPTLPAPPERNREICVYHPLYLVTPGLLATPISSIAAQQLVAAAMIDIIVIDDGSPVSAASEAMPALPAHCTLRLIRRDNGGVASARNAGLEAVAADTDYVAFLDSDDRWLPGHLQCGIDLLQQGASFYFDNGYDLKGRNRFALTPFIRDQQGYSPDQPPQAHLIDGRTFFAALVTECIPHTSQVIYDFRKLAQYRFDEGLRIAGEDHLFWLTLAQAADKVGYHTGLMGARGAGVSINSRSFDWDAPESLERMVDEIGLYNRIARRFAQSADQRAAIAGKRARDHDHFIFLAIRNAARQPTAVARALWRVSKADASIWRRAPLSVLRLRAHRAGFRAA